MTRVGAMKTQFCSLFLVALVLNSCDKAADTSDSNNSSSHASDAVDPKPIDKPAIAKERAIPETRATDSGIPDEQSGSPGDPPELASDASNGIPGVPQEIADEILKEAANASSPEERTRFITEQTNAWRHVNEFREKDTHLPDHRKRELLEALGKKHGISWNNMSTELDAQLKAYDEVMEYRLKGIPGLTEDETFTISIGAIEQYSPDYQKILSIIRESAKKQ